MVTVERFDAADTPDELRPVLLGLTMPNGEMAKVFAACANPRRPDWSGQVIVARVDGHVAGWALRWKCFRGRTWWTLHLYVNPTMRRRRVGSALVAAARYRLRHTTKLRGIVWDDTSNEFWMAQTARTDLCSVAANLR